MIKKLSRQQMAWRASLDIPDGSYVNLGIGLPEVVAEYVPTDKGVIFHTENGFIGMGPRPIKAEENYELINAGKKPVTLLPGGCFFHHADSFAMIRGGHLDVCIMGAFQVSSCGDLANWSTGPVAIPAVGGAMDLALGAKRIFIVMTHNARDGSSKLVDQCSLPLTAPGVVSTVFTDLAVIDVVHEKFVVREMVEGMTLDLLQERTDTLLTLDKYWKVLKPPTL
jgi:3-oxoadipate CoA-transferase beta subunit